MSKMLKRQNRYLISPFASGSNMAWCETVTGHVSIYNLTFCSSWVFFFFCISFYCFKNTFISGLRLGCWRGELSKLLEM